MEKILLNKIFSCNHYILTPWLFTALLQIVIVTQNVINGRNFCPQIFHFVLTLVTGIVTFRVYSFFFPYVVPQLYIFGSVSRCKIMTNTFNINIYIS